MCGITGLFHFDKERSVDKTHLKKMTDVIRHRGPDGEGFYVNGNIGLGHRRLSIIDLQTGDQPMFNDDRSIALVLNGEIYNYIELKEELVKLGHGFRTTSDTEVVIRAYEEWGIASRKSLMACGHLPCGITISSYYFFQGTGLEKNHCIMLFMITALFSDLK